MFSLLGKHSEEVIAIFDIGNGSIGGALVKISPGQAPHVLYSHREPLTFLPEVTSGRLLTSMLKLLKSVSDNVYKVSRQHSPHHGRMHVERAYCVFASPWFMSETRVINVEKGKQFIVTNELIDELVKKEEGQFQIALKGGKYEKIFGDDVALMEKKIIHTKLNGYEVSEPIGKKVSALEVTFFSSFISKEILKKVEEVLLHSFSLRYVGYSSFVLASWNAVRDIYHDVDNFLFLDITGEVTDITLTMRGILAETVSYPHGRNTLIRSVVEGLEITPEIAVSFFGMKSKGVLEKKFSSKFDGVVADALSKWHDELIETLLKLQKTHGLPRKVYVTVDSDVADFFKTSIMAGLPAELAVHLGSFDIHVMSGESVRPYVTVAPGDIADPFIIIDSIFINKLIV